MHHPTKDAIVKVNKKIDAIHQRRRASPPPAQNHGSLVPNQNIQPDPANNLTLRPSGKVRVIMK
ncbi:MAG TPA: hypothetical protein VHZ51_24850 [Ktedonobacteraceae bacterium]|jgi:hypothetical protein|nr:hypothetical protein [Ktedonobacteraceae bacterium]